MLPNAAQILPSSYNTGSGLKTVSLAADPYDLRPAADAILEALGECLPYGPVVILMGEEHDKPAHKALRQILMGRLLNNAVSSTTNAAVNENLHPFAYGLEKSHNQLEAIITRKFNIPLPKNLRGRLEDREGLRQRFLRAQLVAEQPFHAPVTTNNLLSFCLHNNILVHPNDVARTPHRVFLDRSDPATYNLILRYAPDYIKDPISFLKPEGVVLRNAMMRKNILSHMLATGKNIYIQQCGNAHLYGNTSYDFEFEHSLSALIAEVKIQVLPVYLQGSEPELNAISPGAYEIPGTKIVVTGAANEKFKDNAKTHDAERCHLERIAHSSGNELALYPQSLTRKQVKAEVPAWIAEARRKDQEALSMPKISPFSTGNPTLNPL